MISSRTALLATLFCAASTSIQGFTPNSNSHGRVNVNSSYRISHSHHHQQQRTTLTLSMASNANEIVPLKPGSTVALVTPFHEDGSIDTQSLRKILQFHKENKTDGLCILGTTGEASLMTMSERKTVLDIAVEEVKGHIPIMVGTGTIDPNAVREMTLQAIDCGCDASLVVSPPYIKPPQRGLVGHFIQMAELGLPVVVYNVPGRTAVDVTPETIGIVSEHENIIGVKEATGDVSRVQAIRNEEKKRGVDGSSSTTRKPLLLYSGDDSTEAEFVLLGGDGCISVTANVAPLAMHEMMMAALDGNEAEAMRINERLDVIHTNIFCESNPIPAKWALKRMGMVETSYCRPPLMSLDEQYYTIVEEALKKGGVL